MALEDENIGNFWYRGWQYDLLYLLVLAEHGEPVHGYYVHKILRNMALTRAVPTNYDKLTRLVEEGMLEVVDCEKDTRHERGDYYQVTEQGYAWLVEQLSVMANLLRLLKSVLPESVPDNASLQCLFDTSWSRMFVLLRGVKTHGPISITELLHQLRRQDVRLPQATGYKYVRRLLNDRLIEEVVGSDPTCVVITALGEEWMAEGYKSLLQFLE